MIRLLFPYHVERCIVVVRAEVVIRQMHRCTVYSSVSCDLALLFCDPTKMVIIWVKSSYVNAVTFFLFDIPIAWAIHRGLHALQGYYLCRIALSGRPVPVARSRIPIVSGELLRGTFFIIANFIALVIMFFATLGINGETQDLWEPIPRTKITTLSSVNNDSKFEMPKEQVLACSNRSETQVYYWPIGFNLNSTNSPTDIECQKAAPRTKPMLVAQCVPLAGMPCFLENDDPLKSILKMTIDRSYKKIWNHSEYFVDEYRFSNSSATKFGTHNDSVNELRGKEGHAFVVRTKPNADNRILKKGSFVALFRDSNTKHLFLSIGVVVKDFKGVSTIRRPFQILPNTLGSDEFNLFRTLRGQVRGLYEIGERFLQLDIPRFVESLLLNSLRANSVTHPTVVYKKYPNRNATIISGATIVLYAILFACALVLCFMKELLTFVLVYRNQFHAYELGFNDFDELSRTLRSEMEKSNDLPLSMSFAELGIPLEDRGITRVSPVVQRTIEIEATFDRAKQG